RLTYVPCEVGSGSMRHQRREHHRTSGAHRRGNSLRPVLVAADPTKLGQVMLQGTTQMPARYYPRAAVAFRCIGQGDPTGQIRLRLDIGVAIVLMPRERLLVLGLFVDRLVPVEAHVGTNQVVAQVRENWCRRKLAQ